MKESLRYLYQAEPIATQKAHCVVCIVPQDLLADLIPLFPTLTNLVNAVPQDVGKTM